MQIPFTGNALTGDLLRGDMKNAGTLSWSEVDSREAALIRRCTAGDEVACAELVSEHQRTDQENEEPDDAGHGLTLARDRDGSKRRNRPDIFKSVL